MIMYNSDNDYYDCIDRDDDDDNNNNNHNDFDNF